jgi:hypothetical protein
MKFVQLNTSLNNFLAVESDGAEELLRVEFDNGQALFMERVLQDGPRLGFWRVHPEFMPAGLGRDVQGILPYRCAVGERMAFYSHHDGGVQKLHFTEGDVVAINPCDYRDAYHDDLTVVA